MALSGQPSFAVHDVPTVTQLNAWMTTLSDKFDPAETGMTGADLYWPFRVGGPLDMDGYGFTGIPTFRGRENLGERNQFVSVDNLFETVEKRGGGGVLLPGATTQAGTMHVGSNTTLVGHGNSSVGTAVSMTGKSNVVIQDLKLSDPAVLTDCSDVTFLRCNFAADNTNAACLELRGCRNVHLIDCHFTGDASYQVYLASWKNVTFIGCKFEDWNEAAVVGASGGFIDGITFTACHFSHPAADASDIDYAVWLISGSTTTVRPRGPGNAKFHACTFTGISAGVRTQGLYNVRLSACYVSTSVSDPMVHIYDPTKIDVANDQGSISISGCVLYNATNIGLQIGDVGATFNTQLHDVQITGNCIRTADEALVIMGTPKPSPVGFPRGQYITVTGNSLWTDDGTLPAAAVWNLLIDDTLGQLGAVWFGNHADGTSAVGFRSYQGTPGTAGATIGGTSASIYSWWSFLANNVQGTDTTGGANADMVDASARKSVVQNNNT